MTALQWSLFDQGDSVALGTGRSTVQRTSLSGAAWIELYPAWVRRHDLLFDHLAEQVPWRSEERPMYDRTVAVPRLVCFYQEDDALPHPALAEARSQLNGQYGRGAAGELRTTGLCLYRDGRDSVAWHSDRIGRQHTTDTVVAIISLGERRTFLIRPTAGGQAMRHRLGGGDLLVMGGQFQQAWQHCVPKTSRTVGPRISVQFRTRGAS